MKKVVVITGPTGIGKTEISLKIAKRFNAEIINADASQFRRDLNIGTAKIDLSKVSIKHHLIDIIDAEEMFSISDFQRESRKLIDEIALKNKLPFLVGGSGLYINACLNDYNLDSPKHELDIEQKYSDLTNEQLYDILKKLDYNSSLNIHFNNRRRVIRAIELAESGKCISQNNQGDKPLYDYLIICLNTNRDILYNRINQRCKQMLNNGWIEECCFLKSKGINLQNIKDIGYNDIDLFLEKKYNNINEVEEVISKKTRNYAKRQLTWMRNKMNSVFVEVNYNNIDETIDYISTLINNFIQKN